MVAKTMHVVLEAPANALDLCRDGSKVVVAGRSVFKIFSIDEEFVERDNLRVGKNINLNFSCNDVVWSPVDDQVIATAATNGAVVVWNLNKAGRAKQEQVFNDHRRTVNKVNFHPSEAGLLVSGSQDGTMKLFDMRIEKPCETFYSNTESVRDVQFNPHVYHQFCAVSENGKVQLWDTRRPDRCERQWPAHNNHVFACDWHPELRNVLATAGRDKTIKVWDTVSRKGDKMHGLEHTVNTIAPVDKVKWRPMRHDYLGSSALCIDFAVNVWDVKRPFVPFAAFNQHKDVTTDIAWGSDPHTLISTSKDGTLYQHVFRDAVRPGDKANPVGLSFNITGDVTHAHRQFPKNNNHGFPSTKVRIGHNHGHNNNEVFKKQFTPTELFRMCNSKIAVHRSQNPELGIENVIRETAKRYKLYNVGLSEACDINAAVARSLGRHHVALTWNVLKTVHANVRSDTTRPVSGDITEAVIENSARQRLRTSSFGTRKMSSKQAVVIDNSINNATRDTSESEEEEDQLEKENSAAGICQTLTDIASGYTVATITGDFFGDSELAGLGVEGLVSLEGGVGGSLGSGGGGTQQMLQEWTLPCEAFEQKQEIKDDKEDDDLLVDSEAGAGEAPMQTVTVEDKTSSMVVWGAHAQDTRPSWNPAHATREALTWLAETGDVQNAVSMFMVLSGHRSKPHDRVRDLIDDNTLEHWWLSYVDLLHKLQLFTIANEVLSQCILPSVHTQNQQSSTVYTGCTRCGRSLNRTWWCNKCQAPAARCAVCHAVVRGLFVWCQGCGHGGHIKHIKEWIAENTLCPAGCGHHCQYH